MANKNMQTVATRIAENYGVRVIGTECSGSKADGNFQAHFLSLPWRPLPRLMPVEPATDTVQAEWTGRSADRAGVCERAELARSASGTVLSTRSSFMRKYPSNPSGLPKRITNQARA